MRNDNLVHCSTNVNGARDIMNTQETARALAEFLKWAVEGGPWEWDDGSIYGFDIQDKAKELELLNKEPYDPAVHGPNEYDMEAGEDIFVLSDEVKALLK